MDLETRRRIMEDRRNKKDGRQQRRLWCVRFTKKIIIQEKLWLCQDLFCQDQPFSLAKFVELKVFHKITRQQGLSPSSPMVGSHVVPSYHISCCVWFLLGGEPCWLES